MIVPGAVVLFTVEGYPYGTMTPFNVTTDTAGNANSTFKVNKKSGTAKINASISYSDATGSFSTVQTYNQKIDHDSPYIPLFEYPFEGTVATEVPFKVSITDRWGNRIDDLKQTVPSDVHTISLHVHGPAPDDCGFVGNATTHDISKTLDANGNTTVMVKLTSTYGPNSILMDAFGSIPDKLEWIVAATTGTPFSITQVYDPNGLQLPADGVQKFTIKYMIYDRFGNPTAAQNVTIKTDYAGDPIVNYQSNSIGQVWFTYGPKSLTGDFNITATAVNNNSVTISNTVNFFNQTAASFELIANPQTMASKDVNPAITADVKAKVIDIMGNPVGGETVTFSINSISYPGGPYNVTSVPVLFTSSAVSDPDGFATIKFIPGSFSQNLSHLWYNPTSTGTCKVTAVWNGNSKNIDLIWKNYPYLSVITSVSPSTVKVNETIDINVRLKGDGYALQKKPIDVVLATDRSGSMLYDNPDRMHSIRVAAKSFVDKMSAKDRIGLVSFGRSGYIGTAGDNSGMTGYIDNTYATPRTYSDYSTLDKSFTDYTGFSAVKTELDAIVPDHGTPLRRGLRDAIGHVKSNARSTAVKAVIVLSDGDYNWDGDPLARNATRGLNRDATDYGDLSSYWESYSGLTNQNMALYANQSGIKIYSIAFGGAISSGGKTTLQNLATTSGGKYYEASATNIEDVYAQIAGELQENAGVDTQVLMDFGTITVNNVSVNGADVFSYVPDPLLGGAPDKAPGSTWIHKFNLTNDLFAPYIVDQSANWTNYHRLDFNVGTVKINETWETTFRLKVLKDGNINIFGPGSKIRFNDSENTGIDTLLLPPTYITASHNLTSTGMTMKTTTLLNLRCTEAGEIKALLPVAWSTSYTGISPSGVRERVYYSVNNAPYVQFAEITGIPPGTTSQQAQLDVTKLPPGGYQIKVVATAEDTPDTYALLSEPKTVGGRGITFIKIE
ncbi:MAG: VWA domain-containing protein [Methanoregula sp.]|nr:VWA domain-containing protein [Methanoregula sp.]